MIEDDSGKTDNPGGNKSTSRRGAQDSENTGGEEEIYHDGPFEGRGISEDWNDQQPGGNGTRNSPYGVPGIDPARDRSGVVRSPAQAADREGESGSETDRGRGQDEDADGGLREDRPTGDADFSGTHDGEDHGGQDSGRDFESGEPKAGFPAVAGQSCSDESAEGDSNEEGSQHRGEGIEAPPQDVREESGPEDFVNEGNRAGEEHHHEDHQGRGG